MEPIVYYNGALLKESDAVISPFSRGLHYGDGVFETMRSYEGRIFRFQDHEKRLFDGLEALKIKADRGGSELYNAAEKVLQKNGLTDAGVKIIAFRQGGEGPAPPPGSGASVLISAKPFDFERKERCGNGIKGYVVSIRRNNFSPLSLIKSLNYLDNILGRLEAREYSADEALFLNVHNKVAEGATSNIFILRHGILYTPPVSSGILCGITRDVVLHIANEAGTACHERDFFLDELKEADEAFLTNSLMEIMPLVSVNDTLIGKGVPGDITMQLMQSYSTLVKKELKLNTG